MERSRPALLSLLPLLLAVLIVVFASCASDTPSQSSDTAKTEGTDTTTMTTSAPSDTESELPDALELTAEDDGGSFALREDGTITVALEANPSTGYVWEMEIEDPEAALLEQLREPSFESEDPAAAGAGGIMTFTFRAVDPGEMVVRLVYLPPDGGEPTDDFEITLTVE